MYKFIGARIYYLKSNGEVILNTGQREGGVLETTVDDDFKIYEALKKYSKDVIDVLELKYNEYLTEFNECTSYKVNPFTRQIEFDYAEIPSSPNIPIAPSLNERMDNMEQSQDLQDEQIAMTGDAMEFALLEIGRQSEEMANLQNPQPMKAKSLKATPMKASTLSIENNSNQGGTAMAGFLASRIMSAGNKSREEGKKAYEKFFKLRMYKPFQDETDAILIAEDCEDLIAVI